MVDGGYDEAFDFNQKNYKLTYAVFFSYNY